MSPTLYSFLAANRMQPSFAHTDLLANQSHRLRCGRMRIFIKVIVPWVKTKHGNSTTYTAVLNTCTRFPFRKFLI
jgi:hypothetical protein